MEWLKVIANKIMFWYLTLNLKIVSCHWEISLSSQSDRGRLQEVPSILIWLENFWFFFGKVVSEGRWLLTRSGRNRGLKCIDKWLLQVKSHWSWFIALNGILSHDNYWWPRVIFFRRMLSKLTYLINQFKSSNNAFHWIVIYEIDT